MLNPKSKIKEIEYFIKQLELLSINKEDNLKLDKIIEFKELIYDLSIKEILGENINNKNWLNITNIIIDDCNKKQLKSNLIKKQIKECENFMVFRYLEDKLSNAKELKISKNPWLFIEVDLNGKECDWINYKFIKILENSNFHKILNESLEDNNLIIINNELLQINKKEIFSNDIFEDLEVLINKKTNLQNDINNIDLRF